MKIIGVIPARLGSTRLHEKVLKPIAGRPMIQHVWERVSQTKKLHQVIVACDDQRVKNLIESLGGRAMLTRMDHLNGSSRVAEVAEREPGEVFINIQGDEPMIHPKSIDQLADAFQDASVQAATLAVRRQEMEEYQNPNVVKVICDAKGDALYFSRSPIPYFRDKLGGPVAFLKHLGIYGYRKEFLLEFVTWSTGRLEEAEKLEQLRILEQDYKIRVVPTPYDSWSVDTAEDLKLVEEKLGVQI